MRLSVCKGVSIVFSVTSSAILIATVRAGRAREPRLDRLDALLASACRLLYLAFRIEAFHSPSDCVRALAILLSRPRLTGHISKSGLFPEFHHPRSQARARELGCARPRAVCSL